MTMHTRHPYPPEEAVLGEEDDRAHEKVCVDLEPSGVVLEDGRLRLFVVH